MNLDKVLIVDGSYMIHRALHVSEIFNLTNSKGEGTGGVFQFLRSLNSEMRKYPDYFPIVCWDNGLADRRVSVYPNYKHKTDRLMEAAELKKLGAEPEEDEYLVQYHAQREKVMEILKLLGIPSLVFYHWEGDDLMYILARTLKDTIVLTDDKDLIQLLSPTTKISRPMAGELLEWTSYQEENNDPDMRKFVYRKCIVGDPSDNIPACAAGVGGKTAKLIADIMVEHPDDWKSVVESSTNRRIKLFGTEDSYRQFEINLNLIDLSLVEINEQMLNEIAKVIASSVQLPNYFKVMLAMNDLEIHDFDVNGMVGKMNAMITSRGLA